ncbi:MAG: hypothetical protein BYD32DRAFT_426641 [Podila humilis]|nr:MAG: hypothetical protein BYD32DRAFT_426641 [Podila humilis]
MQPAPMTPLMGRGSGAPNHMPSSSNSQTEKPSSIRSNRSTTSRTSMASMRSVRSFIGTMFNNLKASSHANGSGAYPTGYSHHSHGSSTSIGGLHGSRPGSGSSVKLSPSSFTGMLPPASSGQLSTLSNTSSSYFNGDHGHQSYESPSPLSATLTASPRSGTSNGTTVTTSQTIVAASNGTVSSLSATASSPAASAPTPAVTVSPALTPVTAPSVVMSAPEVIAGTQPVVTVSVIQNASGDGGPVKKEAIVVNTNNVEAMEFP